MLVDNPGLLRSGDQLLVDYGDEFWRSFAHVKVRSDAFQKAVQRELGKRLIVDAVKAHRKGGRREEKETTQCRPIFTTDAAASSSYDEAAPVIRRNPDPPPPPRRNRPRPNK